MAINMSNPQYQGFWIRFAAMLLDAIIIGIPINIVSFLVAWVTDIPAGIFSLLGAVIYVWFDGIKGGTPGKLILGMRIVNEQGEYIGIPMAILRYVGRIVSGILLGIGLIMIAFTEKKQGLHDMIAKTYVVKA